MPSFDIVSEVKLPEVRNAVDQAQRELNNRYDFKGSEWNIEEEKDKLVVSAESDFKLEALVQILFQKLAGRNISLKNLDRKPIEVSSVGKARQEIILKQGLDQPVAKSVSQEIRGLGLKVQAQIEGGKVRVSGKKRDDLQKVMAHVRSMEVEAGMTFENMRD